MPASLYTVSSLSPLSSLSPCSFCHWQIHLYLAPPSLISPNHHPQPSTRAPSMVPFVIVLVRQAGVGDMVVHLVRRSRPLSVQGC